MARERPFCFVDSPDLIPYDEIKFMKPERLGETAEFKDRNLFIHGADLATLRGWTGVPNFILENENLTPPAKLIYALLLKYVREDDQCFPGQERLAKEMGSSPRSVVRYIAELEKCGFIKITRRGQGLPNLYDIYLKASFWEKNK